MIPFLVSRQILCGTGKIAQIGQQVKYQISQRADFFTTVLGLQTTHDRPLINTRDEPHADPARFRRLHVIVGDANLSEFSTYLKVGTTALVLEALSESRLRLNLALADPIWAGTGNRLTITCRATVELEDGRELTAIDLQRVLAQAVGQYLDAQGDHGYRRDLCQHWINVLDQLAADPFQLAGRIDWIIKYDLLLAQQEELGCAWDDPRLRALDIKYHQIDVQPTLFSYLKSQGVAETLIPAEQVKTAAAAPPPSTRARLRTACLERYGRQLQAASWDSLVFKGAKETVWRWFLDDPRDDGITRLAAYWDQSPDLETLIRLLYTSDSHSERSTNP
ncbi:MAG: proteasome accessory factor PafA2 family protein [Chloroflexi bacterium]|nr:proteasome accessory factor PafA2 family protein [Chloroflexota bacterium]